MKEEDEEEYEDEEKEKEEVSKGIRYRTDKTTNSMQQSFLRNYQFLSSSRNVPYFMDSSLPRSQAPANCPYSEPDQSSPCHPNSTTVRSILILSCHLSLGLPRGFFPSGLLPKTLYAPHLSPICATCSSRFHYPSNIR